MALDNLRGGTKRVVEENTPLNNLRGGTKRVVIVDGGGGSVDYAKTVQRAETMPTADASNAGQQFLYSGESDATYTHGYIYENVATTTSSSASAEQTVGSTLSDIAVDIDTLESFTGWTTDNSLQIFYTADGWSVDATSLGVTYTGTPNVGDAITITYTAESTTYAWTRVDVQPSGDYLPLSGGTMTGEITLGYGANIVPIVTTTTIGSPNRPFGTIYARQLSYGGQQGRFMIPAADPSTFGFFIALVDPMPTARQDLEAMIFQYMGATDSNYTHGYFYECVTDDNTTWYWKQLDIQPSAKVNTTATLAVADWSSNTQTVTVSGVKADSVVFVSPAPASASDYASAGILCTAQAADSLTFSCTQTPSSAIVVNIVCM